ncbi:hypothetical protein EH165_12665 [Nakamurella antarctica]|uniref:Uncharacterized protein n=1 Tax=Nakamurella antarctica TaxID=1902245 RepID=A0A3G8ZWN5_9ACTN|nr:DUF6153 family protein [Nakamurella antarctica]AZI58864.1 hypothetical protein EH165_12665 [Nakamurella antarctica]
MITTRISAATWLTRALTVVAVLAGVLLMHSLSVQPTASGAPGPSGTHSAMVMPAAGLGASPDAESSGHTEHCASDGCSSHAALHLCMAVIAAVGTALVLMKLARSGGRDVVGRVRAAMAGGVQGRDPPWALPPLRKLSILRL